MKEFRYSKAIRIIAIVMSIVFICVFLGFGLACFFPEIDPTGKITKTSPRIVVGFSCIMIVFSILAIIDAIKARFIIGLKEVIKIGAVSKRVLSLDEIKGYYIEEKFLVIEPIDKKKNRIRISKYFSNVNEIEFWLMSQYPDLKVQSQQLDEKAILNNPEFGATQIERAENLLRAKRLSRWINILGVVTGIWLFFYPKPYILVALCAIVIPMVAIWMVRKFRGLIELESTDTRAYPSVFWGIFGCGMALCLNALGFNILDLSTIWIVTIVVLVLIFVYLSDAFKMFDFKKGDSYLSILFQLIIWSAYTYGTCIHCNCMFDKSAKEKYNVEVMDKRMSTGKLKTFYLKFGPWGPYSKDNELQVNRSIYTNTAVHSNIPVIIRKGNLGMEWVELE